MTEEPCSISDTANLAVEVQLLDPDWQSAVPDAVALVERAAQMAVRHLAEGAPTNQGDPVACELSVALADSALVQQLNNRYRGRDKPTNVLSFADIESEDLAGPGEPRLLGDIVLAREVVLDEASQQGKSSADHLAHLVVHGLLHLLGYDHDTDAAAEDMESVERQVLARLGVADPYRTAFEADETTAAEA